LHQHTPLFFKAVLLTFLFYYYTFITPLGHKFLNILLFLPFFPILFLSATAIAEIYKERGYFL